MVLRYHYQEIFLFFPANSEMYTPHFEVLQMGSHDLTQASCVLEAQLLLGSQMMFHSFPLATHPPSLYLYSFWFLIVSWNVSKGI